MDYSSTLNLPKTDFPMRGNLPQREPEILDKWQDMDIYHKVGEKNQGKPKFILHDGPPYANGNIHMGHVLNKVLKDIVVKYKSMSGFDAPYVPGWDTHGLPIELKAIKDLGISQHQSDKVAFREKCTEYALKYVDIQREQFKRLGVRGDWEHPYITLMPKYEAVQIAAFGDMAKKGYIYKGKKPVYWCADCETALAEAEVEYQQDKSPSIYVKFKVNDSKGVVPQDAYFVIWTTTPWTIPANLGICLHQDYIYALVEVEGEQYIMAKDLVATVLAEIGKEGKIVAEYKGSDLEMITCTHPLAGRDSLVILGDHVTLEAGTGCVHTAPGHGVDDFEVGNKYGLDIFSPVDSSGHMTAEAGEQFAGMDLNTCNKAVCKALEDRGALVGFKWITHQYPHCWRCKEPIVFRATEQWFASIEGFRDQALAEIDKVNWIPAWGHDRIYNMVRDRSDWCISRQRTWGVPIPIFYCTECGQEIINDDTIARIVSLVEQEGSNVWFAKDAAELVPEGTRCPKCGNTHFRKETDIMDVWFDSGSSHLSVLNNWPDLSWPADLYLEGSDQHRGWFNSSLSISVALTGQAPYRSVLTHGFLVDEKGIKQSKSAGNAVDPLKTIDQMGADVLRLWVSSAEYRNDLAISPAIMKQVSESYRKIRNTCRFLLGNLYDFDPAKDQVPYGDLPEMDRYLLAKLARLIDKVKAGYDEYAFHNVYHSIHRFCVVDMSNFYLDVTKDRMYSNLPDDLGRRAAQTVMYQVLDALMRLLVPILSYTMEEVYAYIPKAAGSPESVQLLEMPVAQPEWEDKALAKKWDAILAIREEITAALEKARQEKVIGHPLDAAVVVKASGEQYDLLASVQQQLAVICIVSDFKLEQGSGEEVEVSVTAASGEKCERCWIYSDHLNEAGLCPRCAQVMAELQ